MMNLLCLVITFNVYYMSPHVRISNLGESPRSWSGTTIGSDDEYSYILTCGHGVFDLRSEDIHLQVDFFENPAEYHYFSLPATLIKFDKERDLALIKCRKVPSIHHITMGIGVTSPQVNSYTTIQGFAGQKLSEKLRYPVSNRIRLGTNNEPLMSLNGRAVSGYSGSGIVQENKVVGVQSAGNNSETLCATLEQIKTFLGDMKGI